MPRYLALQTGKRLFLLCSALVAGSCFSAMNFARSIRDNRRNLASAAEWVVRLPSRITSRDIFVLLLYESAFYVAYRYGMMFSQTIASPFWFPDSVLLCALLLSSPRRWWIFVLAPLPIRLYSDVAADIPMWFLLTTSTIDAAKGLAAAAILRSVLKHPAKLQTIFELGVFAAVAVLLVPSLAAFAGAAARSALGHDYWMAWEQWFFGNVTTQMIITPAVLFWIAGARWNLRAVSNYRLIEAGVMMMGLIVTSYIATSATNSSVEFLESRFYLPIPFLFWAAVRFGMAGASGAVAVFAFFAIEAAIQGHGPFAGHTPADVALALQNFLLLRAVPVYFVAVSIDQRRRIELSLQESEQRFRNVANTVPVLIRQSGRDKLCDFFNQSWLKFTGRSLSQELGEGWTQGVHPFDFEHCAAICAKAFDAREPFEMEFRLRRHDGEYRWMLDAGTPRFDTTGAFLGYIGCAIDITDRKQNEEAFRRLEHAQRLAMMGELTAMIAHEVRQPISAILSNADAAEMLLQQKDPPLDKLREIVSDIRLCDLRADETISRIREFLRSGATVMRPLDLNTVVADAVQLVRHDARQKRIDLRCDLSLGLPNVRGNSTHLQHVLLNLLMNSFDAVDTVAASAREIVVTTSIRPDGDLCVAVKDRGCGVPVDQLPRLFESFVTTRGEGLGLGLSIASTIVAAHHGRIWAANNTDGGATFYFTVPRAE